MSDDLGGRGSGLAARNTSLASRQVLEARNSDSRTPNPEPRAPNLEPRTPNPDTLLSVTNLTVGFDHGSHFVPAVIDVSFSIARGETLCIVGESGSGKTLTALSILRLLPPSARIASGALTFKGRDLRLLGEREMQQIRGAEIALVFQEATAALSPVFTIGSQIEEVLRVHGRATRRTARQKAIELLEVVSVPEPARRVREYPHQLSGGLRQRALIAISLACGPSLLIADEPTAALDVTIQAQILDLLRDLQRRMGLALLLITHDLGVVAEMADRVAVMYAGRIVEESPAAALFHEPRHPYTRALMSSIPGGLPRSRLRAIEGTVPPLGQFPPGCGFAPRCPDRFEPCSSAPPASTDLGAERTVRCFLYEGAAASSAGFNPETGSDPGRRITHSAETGSDPGRRVTHTSQKLPPRN